MSDRGTFEDFVLGRSSALLRVAFLLTGDRHAAEELLQDVLERMYVRWRTISGDPYAYARRSLTNRATNRWRGLFRKPERALTDSHDQATDDMSDHVANRDAVVRILRTLPARQRAVLVLRYLEDLSEAETARTLGISVGTVKSQAADGLRRLRGVADTSLFATSSQSEFTESAKGRSPGSQRSDLAESAQRGVDHA